MIGEDLQRVILRSDGVLGGRYAVIAALGPSVFSCLSERGDVVAVKLLETAGGGAGAGVGTGAAVGARTPPLRPLGELQAAALCLRTAVAVA